jgi:hypothetical protein
MIDATGLAILYDAKKCNKMQKSAQPVEPKRFRKRPLLRSNKKVRK